MEKFSLHKGVVAFLNQANIDTDQIIPKQFLKKINREGYGEHLFHDWRYLQNGDENPKFTLIKFTLISGTCRDTFPGAIHGGREGEGGRGGPAASSLGSYIDTLTIKGG